ncbi:TIR domain-containing protein [Solirubrobacter ginsenosidimutans]|uniref:TIR domain-containing protein n=1 Tax=Solirubrobacter ginsenosidimutans TaxID=490573 RepID=A0A9X3MRP6_9ACTN|nr:TIR domain-containing protein [Solirubrobacter ginsenosidimutans]MDA0159993.1 TIR domain-containing protein [Solirubrobacter ginsenosidimutans]
MASLFISYASSDRAAAAAMAERLRTWGFASLFLDADPVDGLPVGSEWEEELYRRLRSADAVIFLGTDASVASRWCSIELAFARAGRKPVFPLWLGGDGGRRALEDRQWLDVTNGGYERLRQALTDRFDARVGFTWDARRPPYPGLRSFERDDAAVFFGRERDVAKVLAHLDPGLGRSGSVAVVGASGSGKSSLVRAGVVPLLERAPDAWVVVPAFTPGERPLASLARALGVERVQRDGLRELIADRAVAADGSRRAVLLVIDQAEELVYLSGDARREEFIATVRHALGGAARLWVLGTLRSEALGTSLQEGGLGRLFDESVLLSPLGRDRIPAVIEGPARKAGIEFAPGLIARMVQETHGGDALPLLAYTLQQLYDSDATADGFVSEEEYDALGGVDGALQKRADAVAATLANEGRGELVVPTLLRLATLDADGQPARRRVPRRDLDEDVVRAFVEARLLTSDGPLVEVAHEALLRTWPPLVDAISASRRRLRTEAEVERLAREWDEAGRQASYLLRDQRLDAVRAEGVEFDGLAGEFYAASVALERDASAAARRRRRWTVGGLSIALVLISAAAVVSFLLYRQANEQSRLSRAGERAATALAQLPNEPVRALRSALAGARGAETPRTRDALRRALASPARLDLRGHRQAIVTIDSTRDGRRIVTASEDGTARIWDAATGRSLHVLSGHDGFLNAARFSPDGRLVATVGGDDDTIRLWDSSTGAELHTLTGHTGMIDDVAFSPDGTLLASFAGDGTVRLWTTADGELHALLRGHSRTIVAAAFDPSGKLLITGDVDDTARIWSVADGKQLRVLRAGEGIVFAVAFSPDGKQVATSLSRDDDSLITLWDTKSGRIERQRTTPDDIVGDIEYTPDGRIVLLGGEHASPRLWTLAGGRDRVLAGGGTPAHFDADGRRVVTAGEDARVYDVRSGVRLTVLDAGISGLRDARFAPDGRTIVTGGDDGVARIWAVNVEAKHVDPMAPTGLAFSPDGRRFATAARTGEVTIREVASGRELARALLATPTDKTRPLAGELRFSPDGLRLFATFGDGMARIWTPDTGEVRVLRHVGNRFMDVFVAVPGVLSRDGARIVMRGDEPIVRDVATGREVTLRRPNHKVEGFGVVRVAAFDPAGKRVVTAGRDGIAYVWNAETGARIKQIAAAEVSVGDAQFSPDGKEIITASDDGVARIWNVATGARRLELRGHTDSVFTSAFSDDGRFVITSASDQTTRIWSARTGEQVLQLADSGASVTLSPHNSVVAVVKRGSSAALFVPCDACAGWEELKARAAQRLGE